MEKIVMKIRLYMENITPTDIETTDGDIVELDDALQYSLDPDLDLAASTSRLNSGIEAIFDGDLDNPDAFESIKLTAISIGNCCVAGKGGDCDENSISGIDIYADAILSDDFDDDEDEALEDILHALVLKYEDSSGNVATFMNWESYGVEIDDDIPDDARKIDVNWDKP